VQASLGHSNYKSVYWYKHFQAIQNDGNQNIYYLGEHNIEHWNDMIDDYTLPETIR